VVVVRWCVTDLRRVRGQAWAAAAVAALASIEALFRHGGSVGWGLCLAALLGGAVGWLAATLATGVRRRAVLAALLVVLPVALAFKAIQYAILRAALLTRIAATLSLWSLALALSLLGALAGWKLTAPLRRRKTALHPILFVLALLIVLSASLLALQERTETLAHVVPYVALAVALALVLVGWRRRTADLALVVGGMAVILKLPARYTELADVAAWLAIGGVALAVQDVAGNRAPVPDRAPVHWWTAWWTGLFPLCALLCAHVVASRIPAAWKEAEGKGVLSSLVRAGHRISDFDHDGHGALFAQHDCAPFDRRIHPGAHEVPGNGIDENCLAGDLGPGYLDFLRARETLNARPPSFHGDIIMVLVDSMRADDAQSEQAVNLRGFRERGLSFDRAYAISSFTVASLLGIFAGQVPAGVEMEFRTRLTALPRVPYGGLLPILRSAGYALGAMPGIMLPGTEARMMGASFDVREVPAPQALPREMENAARRVWNDLSRLPSPHFLYVHLTWPHDAPEQREPYRESVLKADAFIGWLRDLVGKEKADGALWILLADHGEEFGEHGGIRHASTLFEEVVHVPLILAGPPVRPGRIEAVTSLRAIMPTLATMVSPGLAPPGLGPYLCLDGSPCRDMPVPLALELPDRHLHGLLLGRRKIIHDLDRDQHWFFDLAADPKELRPIYPLPADLLSALDQWEEIVYGIRNPCMFWPYRTP
jgi:hypothetical protein